MKIKNTYDDKEIRTIEGYLSSDFKDFWFKNRYENSTMVNADYYCENDYIYSYTEGINTSEKTAIALGTGEYYYSCNPFLIEESDATEIMVFKHKKPYRTFNIDRPLFTLNKKNVINEVIRYLVQFQQLNYFYNSKYDISTVYDDVMIRINHKLDLVGNMKHIKDRLVDDSNKIFSSTLHDFHKGCPKDYSSLPKLLAIKQFINYMNLGSTHDYYTPKVNKRFDRRGLLLKATRRAESLNNQGKINACIDSMKLKNRFICADTVKVDEMPTTGINQIREVVKSRKQEIDSYNLSNFNAKTYRKYKDNLQVVEAV